MRARAAHIVYKQSCAHSLAPSKYIEFINRDENIDFDKKMELLKADLSELFKKEKQSKQELLNVLKELGHEIKL